MINWNQTIKDFMVQPDMVELKRKITELRKTKNIFPKPDEIYNALKFCPYETVKVVILGQDPYSNGTGHGLAFSSLQKETPSSLRNIFKEIQSSIFPSMKIEDLFKTNNLIQWANQGVLLLNTILTVEEGNPNSHKGLGWEKLTSHLIGLLNSHPRALVFMLWGNNAKEYKSLITDKRHLILESVHPSPFSAEKGFFGCNHFVMANDFIATRSDKFITLYNTIDFEKIKETLKGKIKSMGLTIEDWKKQKNEIDKIEQWARLNLGVWIDEEENKKCWKERIDWTLKE
jgi:uracil-DNA glycosylase